MDFLGKGICKVTDDKKVSVFVLCHKMVKEINSKLSCEVLKAALAIPDLKVIEQNYLNRMLFESSQHDLLQQFLAASSIKIRELGKNQDDKNMKKMLLGQFTLNCFIQEAFNELRKCFFTNEDIDSIVSFLGEQLKAHLDVREVQQIKNAEKHFFEVEKLIHGYFFLAELYDRREETAFHLFETIEHMEKNLTEASLGKALWRESLLARHKAAQVMLAVYNGDSFYAVKPNGYIVNPSASRKRSFGGEAELGIRVFPRGTLRNITLRDLEQKRQFVECLLSVLDYLVESPSLDVITEILVELEEYERAKTLT